MKAVSILEDSRISATNALVVMNVGEYIDLISGNLDKNEFQRKRVRSSKTVYALLRKDLLKQCVIPPIVLALTNGAKFTSEDEVSEVISNNKKHLIILDGLQRTNTIIELIDELKQADDTDSLNKLLGSDLRIEVYIGLNRLGILYRMLTLNTGQTPMSLRQQVEMLYLDYIDSNALKSLGVDLIRESDSTPATKESQYNFKDVVEGFNAYLDRDELPIDKADILENINSLEKLSKENESTPLFEKYIEALNSFVKKVCGVCSGVELSSDYIESNGTPFGKNASQVFKKPQAFSGFGAAIGKLFDFGVISDFDEVISCIDGLDTEDPELALEEINNSLLWLKDNSKKIGNAQRAFFMFYFRELFNPETDSFMDLKKAAEEALRKYQSQNM